MVSQIDSAEGTLAVRRPSSVSSRTTTRRRHHRSHHGGSSYQPQNDFPVFSHTGDVEILIKAGGKEQRYLLHRLILAQCSGFFEAGTSEQWSRAQASTQSRELSRIGEADDEGQVVVKKDAAKMRWRYELEASGRDDSDDVPMLVQKVCHAIRMSRAAI